MSHEVTDLEPVFEFLSAIDPKAPKLWEARYVCFIWLSLICMIPFDLKRIDSGNQESLIVKMINLCKHYLCTTGKERDGASLLIARLLSRQDLCSEYLIPYIEWAKERLASGADVFEVTILTSSNTEKLTMLSDHRYSSKFMQHLSAISSKRTASNTR